MGGMICTIVVPSPALTGTWRVLAERRVGSLKEAREWVATNRETWRDALRDDEMRFVAVTLDEEMEPLEAIEHGKNWWGSQGIVHGKKMVREWLQGLTKQAWAAGRMASNWKELTNDEG